MPPTGRPRRLWVVLLASLLTLVACGGGSTGGSDDVDVSEDALRIVGTDDLRFDPEELTAAEGTIEVALSCEPGVNHNLEIVESGEEVAACQPGETTVGTIELEAGSYAFVCTVPGHSATMRGELTVG